MKESAPLAAPALLLAMPQVLDPFFHRSVVLLVHHDEDGSLGFIVNRLTALSIAEVLQAMDIEWGGDAEELTRFGGPVQPQLGTILHRGSVLVPSPTSAEVVPGLVLTQDVDDLARLAVAPPADLRLVLGYAGWGEGQLIEEILRNDWVVAPVDLEIVFADQPESAWESALETAGIDPATLPSWTAAVDEEVAN